jgi:hypothetical protein
MSNITENRLNTVLAAADIAAINTAITAITAKLPAGSLDDDQRHVLKSIDVNNKVFVEDTLIELGISGAGIIPAFINQAFIQNDLTLFEQLDGVEASLLNLLQKIADLKRISGHESYSAALTVYKIYEAANLAGIPGAKQAYDKLKVALMHKADHLMEQMRKKGKCKGNPMFIGFFICLLESRKRDRSYTLS